MKSYLKIGLISTGIGLGIGTIVGYLSKRYYEKWAIDEIDKSETLINKVANERLDIIKVAIDEIYELREALKIMVDPMQYETILEQVKYKMKKTDERYPAVREYIEENIARRSRYFTQLEKEVDRDISINMAEVLGYIPSKQEEKAEAPSPVEESYDEEDSRVSRILRSKLKQHVEDALAEVEYPNDEEEPDDWDPNEMDDPPKMLPNGDIDDEDTEVYVSGEHLTLNHPYVITEWQYTYGKRNYDKVSLQYLCQDDTVLDDDDTELDQKFIGPDNLKAFEIDDNPSIFIRNDQLQIDYEIMWVNGSYIHDYLGRPESEVYGRRIWRSWEKE